MTFIKITDPKQREALARELHETKRSIQASNLQHRLDKIGLSRDLSKMFKPVVEAQREAATKITKTIEDLPAAVPALPPPPPEFADPPAIASASDTVIGPLAQQYLKLSTTGQADHTFGLRVEDDTFMILKSTDAMYQGNSTLSRTPKSSRSYKWTNIVSHIYKEAKYGSGVHTVFLPSNFNQLLDRLELCSVAYRGNNGVRNEIVAILDSLKKAGHINIEEYKKLHRSIL